MVTDATCFCLCRASLEELNVSWCRGVPEPWLGVLADACTNLRKLTVFGCSQVCPASALLCFQVRKQLDMHISKDSEDETSIRP